MVFIILLVTLYLDAFNCVPLALVHDVGVNLRGADVGVGEEMGDGVYVGAFDYLEGGEGVTAQMEQNPQSTRQQTSKDKT